MPDIVTDNINEITEKIIWGNTLVEYAYAFLVFLVALVLFKIFREIILTKLQRIAETTKTDIDDVFIKIFRSLRPPFYVFLSFYFSLQFLHLIPVVAKGVIYILIILVGYQISVAFSMLIDYIVSKKTEAEEGPHAQAAFSLLGTITKVVVWVVILLFILSNMGVNITSFVGALGIGGIAVALAIQNILNDLFSSFAIYFDKPFEVGDFIKIGDQMGVVESIGIKTTRLRALQGEEIVLSNQELTSARIQNFKKLKERRVVFNFGVTYQTSNEKLGIIINKVRNIISSADNARFDRAHFARFDDSALIFEVVYYFSSPD